MVDPKISSRPSFVRLGVVVLIAALLLDQWTKKQILDFFAVHPEGTVAVLPIFVLTLVFNRGISFGLFNQMGHWNVWIFTIISSALSVFLTYAMVTSDRLLSAVGFAMMIGGALGNVIDRHLYGAVVDFIAVHYGDWSFPVFNVADAFVSIGVACVILDTFLGSRGERKT